MRFTIFGATGFIGSNLTKYLQDCGHHVFSPNRTEEISSSVDLGHVIYAIGLTGNFRKLPFETIEAHVSFLSKIIRNAKYDSWLYLSSARIYLASEDTSEFSDIRVTPGADGIYDISKLLGESLCLALDNPKVRIARLSNVYGKDQPCDTFLGSLLSDALSNHSLEIGEDPNSSKDYIALSDVINLLTLIATQGRYRIYNIASGQQITHSEVARRLEALVGRPARFKKNAPIRRFPPINIDRIKNEFDFKPKNFLEELEQLIL